MYFLVVCDFDTNEGCCHSIIGADDVVNVVWLWLCMSAVDITAWCWFIDCCKTTVFVVPSALLVVSICGNFIWTGTVVLSLVGICNAFMKFINKNCGTFRQGVSIYLKNMFKKVWPMGVSRSVFNVTGPGQNNVSFSVLKKTPINKKETAIVLIFHYFRKENWDPIT